MRISFHGAAHTVTGSQHLIEANGARLLLDCGLFQGRRADTYERNLNFSHDPRKVDAVVLSHAHYERKCEVATIGGLSAHARQDLLVKYAMGVKDSVKQIFLVHGEEKPAMTLKGLLKEQNMDHVHYPELHESVEL